MRLSGGHFTGTLMKDAKFGSGGCVVPNRLNTFGCCVDDSISVSAADSSKTNVIISAAIQQDLILVSVQWSIFQRLFLEQTIHRSPENQNLPLAIQQTLSFRPKRTCPTINSPLPSSAFNTPTILNQQLARLYKLRLSQARSKNLANPQWNPNGKSLDQRLATLDTVCLQLPQSLTVGYKSECSKRMTGVPGATARRRTKSLHRRSTVHWHRLPLISTAVLDRTREARAGWVAIGHEHFRSQLDVAEFSRVLVAFRSRSLVGSARSSCIGATVAACWAEWPCLARRSPYRWREYRCQ